MSDLVQAPRPTAIPGLPAFSFPTVVTRAGYLGLPVCILAFCFLGPLAWTVDPAAIDAAAVLRAPGWAHPMGTDALGRDQLARLMSGGAATLLVAGPGCLLSFIMGSAYGLAAGLAPSWLGAAMMRLLDAMLALPALVVLIALTALLQVNTGTLVALLGATAWAPLARLARNEAVGLRGRDYVLAAQQMGASRLYLAWRHLVPVMAPVLLVNFALLLGDCIALVSALGFLGLGVQPPGTSWGQLLQDGLLLIDLRPWWLIVPPGLLIAASLVATSLIGRAVMVREGTRLRGLQ
jgi:peptide/nickel transport system permease protein